MQPEFLQISVEWFENEQLSEFLETFLCKFRTIHSHSILPEFMSPPINPEPHLIGCLDERVHEPARVEAASLLVRFACFQDFLRVKLILLPRLILSSLFMLVFNDFNVEYKSHVTQ